MHASESGRTRGLVGDSSGDLEACFGRATGMVVEEGLEKEGVEGEVDLFWVG